jgi:hypothetical protein
MRRTLPSLWLNAKERELRNGPDRKIKGHPIAGSGPNATQLNATPGPPDRQT